MSDDKKTDQCDEFRELRDRIAALEAEENRRIRAEENLQASEDKYWNILDTIEDGYYETNLQGEFTAVNLAVCRESGYTKAEIIGKNFRYFTPDDLAAEVFNKFNELFRTKTSVQIYDWVFIRKDGKRVTIESSISLVLDAHNQPVGFRGIVRNITERRKFEEELKRYTKELERSNQELQDFAYVASHDLQEPLRKIQSFCERLMTMSRSRLDEREIDYLNRMQNASRRMQTLINDLLAFSRVTTKAKPFELVELDHIMQDVLHDMHIRIEESGAAIEIGRPPIIEADPTQIRQLMQNLLANAIKFRKRELPPQIKISWEILSIGQGEQDKVCRISVADNGIGFDEKYLDRIFTIFQRLHGRTEYEGTGVGLAICRKIVLRHNGTITAESAPGVGSTFIVTLPVHQKIGGKQ